MRVTFLLPRYGWHASGGFAVVYTYAGLLAGRGHHVEVVHARRLPPGGWPVPKGLFARLHSAGGRLRDRMFRPSLRWARPDPRIHMRYVPEISAAHLPDADAIIATWWSTAEAALVLPAGKGRRYHLIQGDETWYGAHERVYAAWRAPLHKIFIAQWLRERALELGVPDSATTHIPNAVAHDRFFVSQPIETRPRRAAMLYSPESYKGGAIGLDILHRVRSRFPDFTAVLFGVARPPAGLPSWMRYIRRASSEQLAADVYNGSAVYLCPSTSEGWHLPATEAMACGCALVASDIGGVRDYAVHGETALLYDVGNVEAGAQMLTRLLQDERTRIDMAHRGRARIATLSWDRSAAQLAALLESGAGSTSPVEQ